MNDNHLTEIEQTIVDMVDKHGCFIMSVFDPEGVAPDFSYSIGYARTVQQPDVIVFSLPKSLRASMINEIWRQMSEDGLELSDGAEISDLLEGHICVAREVTDPAAIAEHFGSAIWYYRHIGMPAVSRAFQIVWPGAHQGLLPWEEGCASEVIEDQPALYVTGTVH
ncbi:DUF4262 domain-containing protein [Croceibacterium aestuarii]|uniref:DUF4262 domain-containing protein n=1 Tax=Croceibacterium aestuarii TaxID=3064139 RepID=UPI00272EAB73|nr:DUF4262 domain-containing protein [Croceibacterium sp. D39]